MKEEKVHEIMQQARNSTGKIILGWWTTPWSPQGSASSVAAAQRPGTRMAIISLFGITLWYRFQTQRAIFQQLLGVPGPQGFVGVPLSACIHLTAITLEHVPKALSPISNITRAPKDFVILGLNEDSQVEGVALGQFTYDNAGEAIQTFHFQGNDTAPYQLIELPIFSNWGHPDYTCIYHFQPRFLLKKAFALAANLQGPHVLAAAAASPQALWECFESQWLKIHEQASGIDADHCSDSESSGGCGQPLGDDTRLQQTGWLFHLFHCCFGNTWYHLTTAASLQDLFVPNQGLREVFLD
uniref:SUN domain-containing protein 2-like n=1 Tax=Phascolarctos cinereus TaxID=38626 RepID=A0A6P5JW58_PHACI